jgi:hypothetical protein
VCRITWVCNMDFSKWRPNILHEMEYLAFHNFFFFFLNLFSFLSKFTFSGPVSFRYQCIVYFHRLLLSKWITKNTWKLLVMQRWHSFMNQILNHLVLLYKRCTRIRIMSLNTYNNNVDIIWHYCIISQINLHG